MRLGQVRLFINKHPRAAIIMACALLSGSCALFFRDSLTPIFRRTSTQEQPVSYKYVRIPISRKENTYKRIRVAHPFTMNKVRFQLTPTGGTLINVGVVRRHSNSTDLMEIRFTAYTKRRLRKQVYVDSTRKFAPGEHANYLIENFAFSKESDANEIFCEIENRSQHKDSGGKPDFAFIVPEQCYRRRPGDFNVILIVYDTLRADHLGCYGYHRDTSPNIDEFAKNGVLFKQAITPAPRTRPAHYSLFTSLYPRAPLSGKPSLPDEFGPINMDTPLASLLRENGYYTVAFTNGGLISSSFGFAKGFNLYWETRGDKAIDRDSGDTKQIFNEAYRWLEENAEIRFFMFLHTYECHAPYRGDYFASADAPEDLNTERIALYDSEIRRADSYFGELIGKLRSMNLMRETLIVFCSDHGEEFGDHYQESDIIPPAPGPLVAENQTVGHGHSLYEELLRVPMIFHVPGIEPRERVIENQVQLMDIFPTILDFLDVEYDGPMQGTSLMDLIITGERNDDPPAISGWTAAGPHRKSIRKNGYKYIWIENVDEFNLLTFKNLHQHELYDVINDPPEKQNIYDQNRELAADFHKILQDHLASLHAIEEASSQAQEEEDAAEESALDSSLVDQLKALGYLE